MSLNLRIKVDPIDLCLYSNRPSKLKIYLVDCGKHGPANQKQECAQAIIQRISNHELADEHSENCPVEMNSSDLGKKLLKTEAKFVEEAKLVEDQDKENMTRAKPVNIESNEISDDVDEYVYRPVTTYIARSKDSILSSSLKKQNSRGKYLTKGRSLRSRLFYLMNN